MSSPWRSNVLIDGNDQPRITDFGLAKRLHGDFGLTITGQVLGSPNFMPPEQTGARHAKVGPHSDVYGLGAICYHLLTGRPPFQAETIDEILRQLRDEEPVSPRLLNSSVSRDLETICLKCLEKEPAKRYATAHALADELERFLKGEPILASASRPSPV
jgi:serine/threonine protein kinase